MEIAVGTPLIYIMEYIENNKILPEYKARILDYCRAELQIGDGKISNEIERAILQAWLQESDEIAIPNIENFCKLMDVYSFQDGRNIKVFEEYQGADNSYYIKITTKDADENVLNTQLVHRSMSLREILTKGGTEDILIDSNGNNIADSRLLQKTIIDESDRKSLKLYTDVNLDGKFD